MIRLLLVLCLFASTAVLAAEKSRPNVLLLCIDDLRPELNCFGVDYIHSPNIDRLAEAGRPFLSHYVQAPTCGASRFTLLTGRYGPASNGALLSRGAALMKDPKASPPSMPAWFRRNGYATVSVGKVSHHPGGRGGPDWDDAGKPEMPLSWDRHLLPAGAWQHPRGAMHGLADGEIRVKAGEMDLFQSVEGPDTIYPDGLITAEGINQLEALAKDRSQNGRPFFLAVGIIRPHLPFGAPARYMEHYEDAELPPIPHPEKPEGRTTWHGSGEFMKYNRWGKDPRKDADFATAVRKHYAACVTYADAQVGRIIDKLESLDLADDTIIVVWGDHGWHLGEHAIWGKHALFEESLRSPLVIKYKGIPEPGTPSKAIVETLDLFPTLCELAGLKAPPAFDGTSLVKSHLRKPAGAKDKPAIGYSGGAQTIRTDRYRLIRHKKGHVELYDRQADPGETKNVAEENAAVVETLTKVLQERLKK